jgi:hypothetical protein
MPSKSAPKIGLAGVEGAPVFCSYSASDFQPSCCAASRRTRPPPAPASPRAASPRSSIVATAASTTFCDGPGRVQLAQEALEALVLAQLVGVLILPASGLGHVDLVAVDRGRPDAHRRSRGASPGGACASATLRADASRSSVVPSAPKTRCFSGIQSFGPGACAGAAAWRCRSRCSRLQPAARAVAGAGAGAGAAGAGAAAAGAGAGAAGAGAGAAGRRRGGGSGCFTHRGPQVGRPASAGRLGIGLVVRWWHAVGVVDLAEDEVEHIAPAEVVVGLPAPPLRRP